MASSTIVVLKYAKPGTKPPVYLAGSFTNPQWTPLPMEWYNTDEDEYEFHKEVIVEKGNEYQYKFRIGEGEWWTVNEDAPTVTDNAGNRNNLLNGPYEYKEDNTDLENSQRTISRTHTAIITSNNITESKPERAETFGGGDAPTSPVNENAPSNQPDHLELPEATAREKNDSSPTPSKIEAVEIANTAAEVADVAATLDRSPRINVDKLDDEHIDNDDNLDSVPRFSHECQLPPDQEPVKKPPSPQQDQKIGHRDSPFEEVIYDPNDPNIEEFPVGRKAIFELIKKTSLDEDKTSVDLEAPSPVVGSNRHSDQLDPSVTSPNLLQTKQDELPTSLDSIEEEKSGYKEEPLASLPHAKSSKNEADLRGLNSGVELLETASNKSPDEDGKYISPGLIELPETPFIESDNKDVELGGDGTQDVEPNNPGIIVSPATPGPSNAYKNIDTAKATAIEIENGRTLLKHRKENAQTTNRPPTSPSSKQSVNRNKPDNVFKKYFKIVFVEWLGGFITRLCGGGRNSLLAITFLALLLIAPALYLSVWP